jgi:radical SAM superfamily enzyme YgiQ (UPF0313 family)
MKITFIDPPSYDYRIPVERVFGCNLTVYPIPNIFTLITAAILRQNGNSVKYIDVANLSWTQKHFIDFLKSDDSDILSIHSVNLSKKTDIDTLHKIHKARPNIPVVFTGPAPTLEPKDYLVDKHAYVIRGEPELTFLDLVENLKKKQNIHNVNGLSYLGDGRPQDNPSREPIEDLDKLPFPARDLLDNRLYFNPKLGRKPWTTVLTSRGCAFRCIFCVPCTLSFARELEYKRFHDRKPPVRMRSVENVLEEFRLLKKQGYKSVSIIDDNFILNKERVIKICEGIKPLNIVWGCLARADSITEEIAQALGSAHCCYVDMGIESFSQETLDYVKKDLRVDDIFRAVEILKKAKVGVKLNVLLGASPFETREDIIRNIKITKQLKPSTVMFSIVSPFPGTEYYKICQEAGWFKFGKYIPTNIQKKAIMNYPFLSSEELERLVRRANYSIYLDPHVIWQILKKTRSPRAFLENLLAYKRKLKF